MSDFILRAWSKEAGVRGLVCITTELAREAGRRHKASPLATAALGYGLTAGVLLGALLKVQQRVAMKVEANGPLRKIVVEADAYGRVRGYVAVPDAPTPSSLGRAEIAAALGRQGLLTVVKDLGVKDLYQGTVALESGELDRELEHYLHRSEQIRSFVEIGVVTGEDGELLAAGGLLFQLLPGHDPNSLRDLVSNLEDLPPLETLLADGYTPENLLAQAFRGISYEVLEHRSLEFSCTCSRERSRQALKILGPDEIVALLAEGEAVVDCHFCHEEYIFDRNALEDILEELETEALQELLDGPEDTL